jgi:ribosomal protein S18 acetylase RimI-like enzyme
MAITRIRAYTDTDYEQLKKLYEHTEWYGGVFDEARDGRQRLANVIKDDPDAILVYTEDDDIKGTISLIEDGRVAMLYRFVVQPGDWGIAQALYAAAVQILKNRGHDQILVYSSPNNRTLNERYTRLGMHRGGDYTCYWADI